MFDQMQAQVIYPRHPCKMPNAARLISEGIHFTHAFTPMTHCCPARASLMTGMYPSKHGIFNNVNNTPAIHRTLNHDCEQFSEKLLQAGYNLAYTGKWHVSDTQRPSQFGWEELKVGPIGGNGKQDYENYLDMPKEDSRPRQRGELVLPGWGRLQLYETVEDSKSQKWDQDILQSGLEKMPILAKGEKPWCLFISINGPHEPFVIPKKYLDLYDPKAIELPPNYHDEMKDRPMLYQRMRKNYKFSEDEVKECIAHYWGYCTMMDEMLGEALRTLDKTGQADDTLVIFLSDHGEFCGAHGLYAKGIPAFDESYRIPLVMRWPNGIKNPGRTVDEFVTHCDISPTVTELAGATPTRDPSGGSMTPFLLDEKPRSWPDAFYSQCNGVEIYYTQRMVRTKKYKLVYNPADVDELYDLENDPYEMINLIDREDLRPIVKELFKKLWLRAKDERDYMSPYHTVAHAPFGPAFALGKS
jgi:arylsulfatase A-like enzyme